MKKAIRLTVFYCLLIIVITTACYAILEPVEIKTVLIQDAKRWDMTGEYCQKVRMKNDSRQRLTSPVPRTKAQWQKMADDLQKAMDSEPEIKICPECGGPMP